MSTISTGSTIQVQSLQTGDRRLDLHVFPEHLVLIFDLKQACLQLYL